jgi:acyl-CoA thioesterase FadM
MNHIFRLAFLLFTAPFKKKINVTATSVTSFRVWPTDLDVLMHMNNGVYLSLLDLGRVDFMIKTDGLKKVNAAGLYPVVASEGIKFKRSLGPFQRFEIRTKFAGWDEKFVYLEQSFWSKNQLYASALIKAKFLKKKGGKVDSQELLEIIGYNEEFERKGFIEDFCRSMDEAFIEAESSKI